jgi:hypothetical protein
MRGLQGFRRGDFEQDFVQAHDAPPSNPARRFSIYFAALSRF